MTRTGIEFGSWRNVSEATLLRQLLTIEEGILRAPEGVSRKMMDDLALGKNRAMVRVLLRRKQLMEEGSASTIKVVVAVGSGERIHPFSRNTVSFAFADSDKPRISTPLSGLSRATRQDDATKFYFEVIRGQGELEQEAHENYVNRTRLELYDIDRSYRSAESLQEALKMELLLDLEARVLNERFLPLWVEDKSLAHVYLREGRRSSSLYLHIRVNDEDVPLSFYRYSPEMQALIQQALTGK